MFKAIDIIQAEHRRLAAMLHCLASVLQDVKKGMLEPDFELFEAVLHYVESFLYHFHHPKEDSYLFCTLRERVPELDKVLDQLEEEHQHGARLVERLRTTLEAYKRHGGPGLPAFLAAAEDYYQFEYKHMAMEEREVLPLARKRLTEEDRARLDAVFMAHEDPLFGDKPKKEFETLYTAILNRAPAPHGLGLRADRH
ncbi:MAG TPA: hemerythrin domain-containing protein [Candidatus Competibacteraceae bacterium]|nr:hemerythrin domain-containing protein [Candidatus Competibacteraceae bacterium]